MTWIELDHDPMEPGRTAAPDSQPDISAEGLIGPIHVGIDVGGTFTRAVALDLGRGAVAAWMKVATTHRAPEGVGRGIVQALEGLLQKAGVGLDQIALIAHSTTQATNALLEGDTARVGIVGLGRGLLGFRARSQTAVPPVALAPGRVLETIHVFLANDEPLSDERLERVFSKLAEAGAEVVVVAEAFGVDAPETEEKACAVAARKGFSATAASSLSKTYGLRLRTRTACINACILPRMMSAAEMTVRSVQELTKPAAEEVDGSVRRPPPIMIMRSDGGIMSLDEMRRRPIQTILSGPAAGVAAALQFARVSDGIFLEIGGTSTDISVIKDGRARQRSATVGGHPLHMKALDIRTVGIAGGSLPLVHGTEIEAVGPRSAHIAGVAYSCFTRGLLAEDVRPVFLPTSAGRSTPPQRESSIVPTVSGAPPLDEPAYWCFTLRDDPKLYAVTPTCAANLLGQVPASEEAHGDTQSVQQALLGLLGRDSRRSAEDVARQILARGAAPIERVIGQLIRDYKLDPSLVTLVGGGGGAWVWVPFVAKRLGMRYTIVDQAPVISAIGCATALLRETVERSVMQPTETDVLAVRRDVVERLVQAGAARESIVVEVEVDTRRGVIRATGSGSTRMARREGPRLPEADLAARARDGIPDGSAAMRVGSTGRLTLFSIGSRAARRSLVRVVDASGAIRWQRWDARWVAISPRTLGERAEPFIEEWSTYGDAGRELPELFLIYCEQVVDLSGLADAAQVLSMAHTELEGFHADEPAFLLAAARP